MAAPPFLVPSVNATFSAFDIFTDGGGGAARNTPPPPGPNLPGGPCNFVDLTHGPNGPRCGCRRFWSRHVTGTSSYNVDQMSWCMCSHHACFHEDVQSNQSMPASIQVLENVPDQENEKPKSSREPLSPVVDLSFHQQMTGGIGVDPADYTTFDFGTFPSDQGLSVDLAPYNPPPPVTSPVRPAPPATNQDSMPDTLSWDNMQSTQEGVSPLPPIPSQFLLPDSPAASIATTSSARYLRPFGGIGLTTLSSVPPSSRGWPRSSKQFQCSGDTLGPKQGDPPTDSTGECSPDSSTPSKLPFRTEESLPHASVLTAASGPEVLQGLANTVEDHEHRLEKLEAGSFFDPTHEECFDKHDTVDLRMTEMESRMDDFERRLNDDESVTSSHASSHPVERSRDVVAAENTFRADVCAETAALTKQVHSLQSQFNNFPIAVSPSFSSPWLLEVVFLPFPVKGIWHEAQDFKTPRLAVGREEWSEAPSSNTRATPGPESSAPFDEWAGDGAGWLLPRACIPGRMIEQRLKSRGFVKTATVQGHDARSVHSAVREAFNEVFGSLPRLENIASHYALEPHLGRLFGLQHPWVPLRKVHKDSRLRFLAPPELVTPVLWDVNFLKGSVVMKATGVHRLYITQPEAYLQNSQMLNKMAPEFGSSWQTLREMACTRPDLQSSNNSTSEPADAEPPEDCWQYNARLDASWAIRLPFQNHPHHRQPHPYGKVVAVSRTSDASTQFFSASSNRIASSSPGFVRAESPLVQRHQRKGSRQPSFRAGSVSANDSPALPSPRSTRRASSYASLPGPIGPNYLRHSSPLVTGRPSPRLSVATNASSSSSINKRRLGRDTRSPSMRLHHTPRNSYRGLSRSPSVTPLFQNVYIEEQVGGETRLTPIAYATPFSNAPLENALQHHGGYNIGIFHEDSEDDKDMFYDEDQGSSTTTDDDDPDVDVYQDEEDMLDDLESGSDHHHHHRLAETRHRQSLRQGPSSSPSQQHGPEDDPLPGYEDKFMPDSENVNPADAEESDFENRLDDDTRSEASSSPSEYPSTQQPHQFADRADRREMTHGLEAEDACTGWNGFHTPGDVEEEDDDDSGDDDDDDDDDDDECHGAQNQW
ncbi:hypothetical protein BD289DRAFT_126499 [Coniella lustricola]|uniref:Uncharacterized protein n=1 Tax=Coniella lustricola TaxID=2025994 RepID=A0A2T3AFY3_9PEZI|nr:hypothetical protein BD289DRAFT_126499 [Coniella lustricola]